MLLHWNQFAALAAFVAVQAGLPFSLAGEGNGKAEPESALDNSQFWEGFKQGALLSSFGQDWFGGGSGLLGPMSSVLHFLSPTRASMPGVSSTVRVYFDQEDEKSCQMLVATPPFVKPSDLRVSFHPQFRTVGVSFRSEEKRELHHPQRGDSFSSRSISGSSTVGLPDRCMASAAVLMSQHAGVVFADERGPEDPQCMIVFPSRAKLEEYVNDGLLPEDIIARIESGGEAEMAGLSELQLCLASGFTEQQCEKLGNRRPRIASVPSAEGASGGIPMPIYDVSLGML